MSETKQTCFNLRKLCARGKVSYARAQRAFSYENVDRLTLDERRRLMLSAKNEYDEFLRLLK